MATHDLSPMNFEVIWHVLGFLSGILRLHALIALLAPFPKWMKLFHFILGPILEQQTQDDEELKRATPLPTIYRN